MALQHVVTAGRWTPAAGAASAARARQRRRQQSGDAGDLAELAARQFGQVEAGAQVVEQILPAPAARAAVAASTQRLGAARSAPVRSRWPRTEGVRRLRGPSAARAAPPGLRARRGRRTGYRNSASPARVWTASASSVAARAARTAAPAGRAAARCARISGSPAAPPSTASTSRAQFARQRHAPALPARHHAVGAAWRGARTRSCPRSCTSSSVRPANWKRSPRPQPADEASSTDAEARRRAGTSPHAAVAGDGADGQPMAEGDAAIVRRGTRRRRRARRGGNRDSAPAPAAAAR